MAIRWAVCDFKMYLRRKFQFLFFSCLQFLILWVELVLQCFLLEGKCPKQLVKPVDIHLSPMEIYTRNYSFYLDRWPELFMTYQQQGKLSI